MHRSGTSATAGLLNALGAREPRHPIPATPSNPKGFWESIRLMELHDRLLAEAGSAWDDWQPLPRSWFASSTARQYRRELSTVLDEEFADADLFLVKDPRMCRLMPFWQVALRDLDIDAAVVLTVRSAADVAASLSRRNQIPERRGLLLWLRHVLEAERDTRSMTRVFVGYDDLLTDWRAHADRIEAALGLSWPRHPSDGAVDINEVLDVSLRHHRAASPAAPREDRGLLGTWVRHALGALEAMCAPGGEEDRVAMASLDRIHEEFDHWSLTDHRDT